MKPLNDYSKVTLRETLIIPSSGTFLSVLRPSPGGDWYKHTSTLHTRADTKNGMSQLSITFGLYL